MNTKQKPTCSYCGTDHVSVDAWAAWDENAQRWELSQVFDDDAFCHECDGPTKLVWEEGKP